LATARDGKKCMEMIAQEIPDLLILDLLMPRMDGWGVIREMRSEPRFAKVPILVLTTVIEDASRRRYELETGMAMDVQDYVQKPAKPDDLIRRVERMLTVYA
jgi:two-component system alkaline phosphatase synthesis response regulator PhoP